MLSFAVTMLAAMQSPRTITAGSRAAVSPAAASSSPPLLYRRQALSLAVQAGLLLPATAAMAESAPLKDLTDAQFAYTFSYPDDWKDGSKPVKTHQHELLLSSTTQKGVKLGVTVDPVKIDSLEAFGSLDQTTERVLGVERTRDGVKEVTLRANAAEVSEGQPTYYTIDYVTVSSRGNKIYCCECARTASNARKPRWPSSLQLVSARFHLPPIYMCAMPRAGKYCIANRKLYVLQAQANADAYDADDTVRGVLRGLVSSFKVTKS